MTSADPLGYLIKRTQQALRYAMDRALSEIDLTTPQYAALSELSKEQGLSNAELSRRCFVTPQTMHHIVRGLESRDLIQRSQHPEHGRIQQVRVTAEGERLLSAAHEIVFSVEERMTRALSDEEVARVSKGLTKCCEALEGK